MRDKDFHNMGNKISPPLPQLLPPPSKLSVINRKTTISLGLLALILSPLMAAIIFLSVINSKLISLHDKIVKLEACSIVYSTLINKDILFLINKRISELEEGLRKHIEKGIYKLPHPEGAEAELDKIYIELKSLREFIKLKAYDRWTSSDDKIFMMEFSRENNLKMIIHKKSIENR